MVRTLDVGREGDVVAVTHFNTESASLLVYATQVREASWRWRMCSRYVDRTCEWS